MVLLDDPQLGVPLSESVLPELRLIYSPPPNVSRLVMLVGLAAVIGTAVYRSKHLVERVARETETAENRKCFIPNEISDAMSDEGVE